MVIKGHAAKAREAKELRSRANLAEIDRVRRFLRQALRGLGVGVQTNVRGTGWLGLQSGGERCEQDAGGERSHGFQLYVTDSRALSGTSG